MNLAIANPPTVSTHVPPRYDEINFSSTKKQKKISVPQTKFKELRNYTNTNGKAVEQNKPFQNTSKENSVNKDFNVEIKLPDFNSSFNLYVIDLDWSLASNEVVLYLNLDGKLGVKAILEGHWEQNQNPSFQVTNLGLKLAYKEETPISIFLSSTLWAILGLSSQVKVSIPQLNYDLTVSFELPIDVVSHLLQERQIAYRLLVIQEALGITLPFPQDEIKGEDIEAISFCYHAIIDRQFDWFANEIVSKVVEMGKK